MPLSVGEEKMLAIVLVLLLLLDLSGRSLSFNAGRTTMPAGPASLLSPAAAPAGEARRVECLRGHSGPRYLTIRSMHPVRSDSRGRP
jgi:hypothetical protein